MSTSTIQKRMHSKEQAIRIAAWYLDLFKTFDGALSVTKEAEIVAGIFLANGWADGDEHAKQIALRDIYEDQALAMARLVEQLTHDLEAVTERNAALVEENQKLRDTGLPR